MLSRIRPNRTRMDELVTNDTNRETPVGERLRSRTASFSPAERKLARALLATYPPAGLESVAKFAERAAVSPPTVTRFVAKLGFRGYPEFQRVLRDEVQARLSSPLSRSREARPGRRADSLLADVLEVSRANLQTTQELISQHDSEEVVERLPAPSRRVCV